MKHVLFAALLLLGNKTFAQFTPECADTEKPDNFDEDRQRAFMQNYFIASSMPLPFPDPHPSSARKSSAGFDMSLVGRLSCQERLVLGGTKTEKTSKTPLFPRIYAKSVLFSSDKLSLGFGATFLPPLPLPHLSLWHTSTQLTLTYEPHSGIAMHLRGFMSLNYLRAAITSTSDKPEEIKDDWFSFVDFGSDLAASFAIPVAPHHKIIPFISFGVIKGASIFVVGEDSQIVPNDKYPLLTGTSFIGLSYHGFDGHLQIGLVVGGAINTNMSTHMQLGYGF